MIPYCLNIHPGETASDVCTAIDAYTCAVKRALSPDTPYPVGLRLSAAATAELSEPSGEKLAEFARFLDARQLVVTGINGFPYGTFHHHAVKTNVYSPDWSTRERLDYTLYLASILSALQPHDTLGSISTVPLAYKAPAPTEAKRLAYTRQCLLVALHLNTLLREEGAEICLAVEPEPDCLLEDTTDFLAWYEDELLVEGRVWLTRSKRFTEAEAEALIRRHIGICFDTCHFAVGFEEPLSALQRLERAGVRIARIQLSAAIQTTIHAASLHALEAFVEPVYLHQTRVRDRHGRITYLPDLTQATLRQAAVMEGCALRTHFHVPLFWAGDDLLQTTRTQLNAAFFRHIKQHAYPLEIETYTFSVLPTALRAEGVVPHLIKETQWALAQLESISPQ